MNYPNWTGTSGDFTVRYPWNDSTAKPEAYFANQTDNETGKHFLIQNNFAD
jgi:hypothetical protein